MRMRTIKRFLSVLVVVAITVIMLVPLTEIVREVDITAFTTFDSFFKKDREYDVLFLGSSHPQSGIFPMELWRDYGIASYNCAVGNGNPPNAYWTMMNMLDYAQPKLIVLECLRLGAIDKVSEPASAHTWMDSTPLSKTKLQTIDDLFSAYDPLPESDITFPEYEHKEAFVWDFVANHYRWSKLKELNFTRNFPDQKGAMLCTDVVWPTVTSYPQVPEGETLGTETTATKYARMIIEECQARGIEVMLLFLPFVASEGEQREANTAAALAEEYGLHYLNFLKNDPTELGVDYTDGWNHLNASGARKATDGIGQFIMDHYDIPDRRGDPAYAAWFDDYNEYTQFKLDTINNAVNFRTFLMLLYDKNFSSCVFLSEKDFWHNGSIYEKLLNNIHVDSARLLPGGPTLAVIDNARGEVSYLAPGMSVNSSFGEVSLVETEGTYGININGGGGIIPGQRLRLRRSGYQQ